MLDAFYRQLFRPSTDEPPSIEVSLLIAGLTLLVMTLNASSRLQLSPSALSPVLVLFTLVPYFSKPIYALLPGEDNYINILVEEINQIIPGVDISITDQEELEDNIQHNIFTETIRDIIDKPRYGLLSLGFFLALFFS